MRTPVPAPRRRAPRRAVASLLALAALPALPALAAPARADDALTIEQARDLERRLVRLAAEATPKTVMVQGIIGLGTGAVIDPSGVVVTNAHVAAGARFAILLRHDGQRVLAKRKGIDYERDLAVLETVEPLAEPWPSFQLHTERPSPGTWVAALGYPGGPRGDAKPTFTAGRVVQGGGQPNPLGFLDYSDAIRVDAPIFSGNSGGPLVDLEGRLVGLNGAVDLSPAALGTGEVGGLAIPAALVEERIRTLVGGVVRLPGGTVLDPREQPLLRALDERLDALVQEMMEAQLDGRAPGAGAAREAAGRLRARVRIPEREDVERRTRIIESMIARTQARSDALAGALAAGRGGATALRLEDGSGRSALATPLAGVGLVACASSFDADASALTDEAGRRYEVAAWSPDHDLLLLEPRGGERPAALEAAARAAAVGSVIGVVGPAGIDAAGVLSAAARPIPVDAAALLGGGAEGGVETIVRRVVDLAEAFGQDEIADLGRQIVKALEIRQGFSMGSPPRPYPRALSVDAPLSPRHAGAPVIDLGGRVVGVVVGVAHLGTTYAIPVDAIHMAFGADGRHGDALRGEAAARRNAAAAGAARAPAERSRERERAPRSRDRAPRGEGLERY